MRSIQTLLLAVALMACGVADAQSKGSVATRSRDAALSYIGTTNFIVGRVGYDCLALLGRRESPKQFATTWQQRNFKYVNAANIYMGRRLQEANALGGAQKRAALYRAMISPARANGEAVIQSWFKKDGQANACRRAVKLIDAGGFDISPRVPLYHELEGLAAWARQASTE